MPPAPARRSSASPARRSIRRSARCCWPCHRPGVILFQRNCADRAQLRALTDELHGLARRSAAAGADRPGGRPGDAAAAAALAVAAVGGARSARLADDRSESRPRSRAAAGPADRARPARGRHRRRLRAGARRCRARHDRGDRQPLLRRPARLVAMLAPRLRRRAAGRWGGAGHQASARAMAGPSSTAISPCPWCAAGLAELRAAISPRSRACATCPFAMTAHVVYPALDPRGRPPPRREVIARTIRGAFGVQGLLLSDDLAMQALSGTPGRSRRWPPWRPAAILRCTARGGSRTAARFCRPSRRWPARCSHDWTVSWRTLAESDPDAFDPDVAERSLATLLAGTVA